MRVALCFRQMDRFGVVDFGTQVWQRAVTLTERGVSVTLFSEELSESRNAICRELPGLDWTHVRPRGSGFWYLSDDHAYADALYDAVVSAQTRESFAVVEFQEAGGEGFTLIRAKRLLGEFPDTTLRVWRRDSGLAPPHRWLAPTSHETIIRAHMESYCLAHTDDMVTVDDEDYVPMPLLDHRSSIRRDAAFRNRPPRCGRQGHVVFLGGSLPSWYRDVVVNVMTHLIPVYPGISFTLYADPYETDAFGRPTLDLLYKRLGDESSQLRVAHVLDEQSQAEAPSPQAWCILPADAEHLHSKVAVARALGWNCVAVREPKTQAVLQRSLHQLQLASDATEVVALVLQEADRPEGHSGSNHRESQHPALDRRTYKSGQNFSAVSQTSLRWAKRSGRCDASVVIPLFNQGQYLIEAVESVRRSEGVIAEVIVVNDGSTDPATNEIFEDLKNVVKVSQPNRGLSAARNAGIAMARAEHIVPLDADDALDPQFLSRATACLRAYPDLGYIGSYIYYHGLFELIFAPVGYVPDLMPFLHTDSKSMLMYRAQALEAIGGYDESLPAFEDWDLQLRLHNAGFRADILPRIGYRYRRHYESMSHTWTNAHRVEILQQLILKHAYHLEHDTLVAGLLALVWMWKAQWEPSPSVRLSKGEELFPSIGNDNNEA